MTEQEQIEDIIKVSSKGQETSAQTFWANPTLIEWDNQCRRLTFFSGTSAGANAARWRNAKAWTMPTLLKTQQAMRVSLLNGDYEAMAAMLAQGVSPDTDRTSIAILSAGLTKALRLTYPVVQRLVGDEFFEATVQRFVIEQPPCVAHLYQYGDASLNFFKSSNQQQLCLIWQTWRAWIVTISCALHAPDKEASRSARTCNDSVRRRRARFVCWPFHPSNYCVFDYPADYIWQAVIDGDDGALRSINLTMAKLIAWSNDARPECELTRSWNRILAD